MHIRDATENPQVSKIRLPSEIHLMCRHFLSDPILDVDRGSYRFGPIKLGHALFFQHFRRIHTTEIAPNSHLLQITVELTGKVIFSAIRWQTLDLAPHFPFDNIFEVQETVKDFTLLFDEVDPSVSPVVVNEGDEISTPAKTSVLCRPPNIGVYQVELVPAPITLVVASRAGKLHKFVPSGH